jgi:hypothetical protein
MLKSISLTLAVLVLFLYSTSVAANENQLRCYDRDKAETLLNTKYEANIAAMGVVSNGTLVQLYLGSNGSFHVIIIPPNDVGKACPLLWGENWEWNLKFLDTLPK